MGLICQWRHKTSPKLWLMRRFFWRLLLSFLTKYNGGLAGFCILMLVVGASFHVMHGQFEADQRAQLQSQSQSQSQSQREATSQTQLQAISESTEAAALPSCAHPPCHIPHQTESFNLLRLFFSRES